MNWSIWARSHHRVDVIRHHSNTRFSSFNLFAATVSTQTTNQEWKSPQIHQSCWCAVESSCVNFLTSLSPSRRQGEFIPLLHSIWRSFIIFLPSHHPFWGDRWAEASLMALRGEMPVQDQKPFHTGAALTVWASANVICCSHASCSPGQHEGSESLPFDLARTHNTHSVPSPPLSSSLLPPFLCVSSLPDLLLWASLTSCSTQHPLDAGLVSSIQPVASAPLSMFHGRWEPDSAESSCTHTETFTYGFWCLCLQAPTACQIQFFYTVIIWLGGLKHLKGCEELPH